MRWYNTKGCHFLCICCALRVYNIYIYKLTLYLFYSWFAWLKVLNNLFKIIILCCEIHIYIYLTVKLIILRFVLTPVFFNIECLYICTVGLHSSSQGLTSREDELAFICSQQDQPCLDIASHFSLEGSLPQLTLIWWLRWAGMMLSVPTYLFCVITGKIPKAVPPEAYLANVPRVELKCHKQHCCPTYSKQMSKHAADCKLFRKRQMRDPRKSTGGLKWHLMERRELLTLKRNELNVSKTPENLDISWS